MCHKAAPVPLKDKGAQLIEKPGGGGNYNKEVPNIDISGIFVPHGSALSSPCLDCIATDVFNDVNEILD